MPAICAAILRRIRFNRITAPFGSILSTSFSIRTPISDGSRVVPRVGFRGTYYDETRDLWQTLFPDRTRTRSSPDFLAESGNRSSEPDNRRGISEQSSTLGSRVRSRFRANGKRRRTGAGTRRPASYHSAVHEFFLGLQLRISNPASILQFDRFQPSTQFARSTFPQFTTIDSIDNWTVARVGRAQPAPNPPGRSDRQLDGTRNLHRREFRQPVRQDAILQPL